MKNFDKIKSMEEARAGLFDAMKNEDAEVQAEAFAEFTNALQEDLQKRYSADRAQFDNATRDDQILVNRGVRKAFTSSEMKYFNAVVERGGFDGVEEQFPVTIVQEVFKDIRETHPIISQVDAQDVTGLMTFVLANPNAATAYWGPICGDISQMILEGFKEVSLKASRLSGFVAICKGMLDLGPSYLGEYIYQVIYEIMNTALELAIVDGDGANKPIGMNKSMSNGAAVDNVITYADKAPVEITDLTPADLSGVRALLSEKKMDRGTVAFLVNPTTYWLKVFPKLATKTESGAYVVGTLPSGETVIQSHAVPVDTAIVGVLKNYLLAVSGKMEVKGYDQTLAIEDMNLYIAKMYATGMPKHKDAFIALDLSGVTGAAAVAEDAEVVTP